MKARLADKNAKRERSVDPSREKKRRAVERLPRAVKKARNLLLVAEKSAAAPSKGESPAISRVDREMAKLQRLAPGR